MAALKILIVLLVGCVGECVMIVSEVFLSFLTVIVDAKEHDSHVNTHTSLTQRNTQSQHNHVFVVAIHKFVVAPFRVKFCVGNLTD